MKKIELRICSNGYYYVYFENEIINIPNYIEFDKFNYIDAKELVDLANQEIDKLQKENDALKSFIKDNFSEMMDSKLEIKNE